MSIPRRIFTFWEPANSMPAYLQLCMQTWRKFLPEYEIIQLDYASLGNWLPDNVFDWPVLRSFTLPMQADAIRCAVLKRWGGVWLDCDTIITSQNARLLLDTNAQFTLVAKHICFIMAQKEALVLKWWETGIRLRLWLDKFGIKRKWDCLGNSIIRVPLKILPKPWFASIDKYAINALPEQYPGMQGDEACPSYQKLYFTDNKTELGTLINNGGILCLHNSWTPKQYLNMDAKTFLEQPILLARLLNKLK